MSKFIQIQWTCENMAQGKKVAHLLLEKRLVACVNIFPEVESFFLWEGRVDQAKEVKVLLKTCQSHFETVKNVILENSSYSLPEILSFPIEDGHQAYLEWMEHGIENCKKV